MSAQEASASEEAPRTDAGTPPPRASLREDLGSEIPDAAAASQIYNRGYYGEPQPGGGLRLDPRETAYLLEMGRLRVEESGSPLSFAALLARAHHRGEAFEILYLVYRDLRQRGYVVRPGPPPFPFALLPRGGSPQKNPPRFWVEAFSERTPFSLTSLETLLAACRGARRSLLLGVVDEESDLTFYRVREVRPQGLHAPRELPTPGTGWFFGDRVSIFPEPAVGLLGTGEGYGSPVGERLELSLLEAWELCEGSRLVLKRPSGDDLSKEEFQAAALVIEPDLPLRLPVYRDLRRAGLLPKTGFKYGAHFRAYEKDPSSSHARYLVHVVPPGWKAPWPELARAIRLAQGVRKQFLLSTVHDEASPPVYYHLERTRP